MNDTCQSPFNARYASAEMSRLFSPDMRYTTWRKLWVALAADGAASAADGAASAADGGKVRSEKFSRIAALLADILIPNLMKEEYFV